MDFLQGVVERLLANPELREGIEESFQPFTDPEGLGENEDGTNRILHGRSDRIQFFFISLSGFGKVKQFGLTLNGVKQKCRHIDGIC